MPHLQRVVGCGESLFMQRSRAVRRRRDSADVCQTRPSKRPGRLSPRLLTDAQSGPPATMAFSDVVVVPQPLCDVLAAER